MDSIMKQWKQTLPFILKAAFCAFLWGTAIPTIKVTYQELQIPAEDIYNRFVLAGIRFTLSGFLIGPYMFITSKKLIFVKGKQWISVFGFGLLNTTLQYMFFYTGVGNTGAIKGVLIDTSKPLIIVLLAHFFTHDDKITRNKILGLFIGFVGVFVANIQTLADGGLDLHMTWRGEIALFMASFMYAVAVLYGKKIMKSMSSLVLNMHQMVLGGIILFVIGYIGAGGYRLVFNQLALVLLIYSSFLSAIAFVLWYQLIEKHGASKVAIYVFLIPVFGSFISSTIFPGERLTWNVLLSLVLMSIGIFLVNRQVRVVKNGKGDGYGSNAI